MRVSCAYQCVSHAYQVEATRLMVGVTCVSERIRAYQDVSRSITLALRSCRGEGTCVSEDGGTRYHMLCIRQYHVCGILTLVSAVSHSITRYHDICITWYLTVSRTCLYQLRIVRYLESVSQLVYRG